MTETEVNCVDKMLTKFIKKTAYGVRSDFYKKAVKSVQYEEISEIIYESPESRINLPIAECGLCAGCPDSLICAAINELTEKQQFIITKIFFETYVEHEVAALLGTSQQDVHYHKAKALKRLREILPNPSRRKPRQPDNPSLYHDKGGEQADGL